jgi:glycosyltransferase involved in cell wall biosynthesis
MTAPLISIVTPSYNQGKYLRQTIQSVLNQDYSNIEYWVIDGGSSDESVAVMREFEKDPRFHWLSEKDKGQSDAINKGLARCTGEIFNWINSDDYLEPGALRKVAEAFEGGADVVCGVCRKFEDLTGETTGYMQTEIKGTAEAAILVGRICQQGTFLRTSVMKSLGVREDLHCAMDVHFWVKYLVAHGLEKVRLCDALLAHFRQHPESKTGKWASQFKQEINAIYLDLFSSLGAPDYLREYLRSLTGLDLPPTPWTPGEHLRPNILFSGYCEKVVRLYYHDKAYERAWIWLRRAIECRRGLNVALARFWAKTFYRRTVMRQGYRF